MYERDLLYKEIQNNEFESPFFSEPWFDSLPLIICGPILRKVYYDSVSVWLAFKEDVSDITLEVFEAANTENIKLSGTVKSPIKLGKNLYITLVMAKSATSKLQSDTIYGYKISFKYKGLKKDLSDPLALKGGIKSISYKTFDFPTFCLPSDDINNLKIVHGSCRKPHGGKTDALRALDTMIEINHNNVKERPQLLCLSGDQIYSDDVSDTLLFMIQKAMDRFLGWKENLPKKVEDEQLRPGNRKDIIAKTDNKLRKLQVYIPLPNKTSAVTSDDLTTSDAKSHLIFFGEFMFMYLFAYSEVLWSRGFPNFMDIFPEYNIKAPNLKPGYYERRKNYVNENKAIKSFLAGLPFIRKALANISTLMIFDDHEITDDWFITKEWIEAALPKGTLSRQYIFNGLLAYALFQDWGNDFKKYESGSGQKILQAVRLNNTKNSPDVFTDEIEDILLPKPKLERDDKNKSFFLKLKSPFNWHYQISYKSFNLLLLNTRTEREFFDQEKPLGNLIKNLHLKQVDTKKLLVVVSATPVFGNMPMEIGQEKFRKGSYGNLAGIASMVANKAGMYEADQEAWTFSDKGFTRLLNFFSIFQKILILSGDVHYAFTAYIKLWRKTDSKYHLTEIVQSTSSALKNSTESTHYPAIDKYGLQPKADTAYKMIKILGKKYFKERDLSISENPRFENTNNLIFGNKLAIPGMSILPELQFTVQYKQGVGYNTSDSVFQDITNTNQSRNENFNDRTSDPSGALTVVGKDNISLIGFTDNSITSNIWFASGGREKPDDKESKRLLFPYVKHKIVFNNKFREEDLPINDFLKRIGKNASVTVK